LEEWIGPLASSVVVVGGILGGMLYIIRSEVNDVRQEVISLKENIGGLKTDLGKTNDRIDGVFSQAIERLFPKPTASTPAIRGSLEKVNDLLEVAKTQGIKVDPQVISRYGTAVHNLRADPSLSSVASQTLSALLAYRSFLNVDLAPPVANRVPYSFLLNVPWEEKGYEFPLNVRAYYGGGKASSQESARIEHLEYGSPFKEGSGYKYILLDANRDTIKLDNLHMKNVIIYNARITYFGDPLLLENVYFVNCTFGLSASTRARELGQRILTAAATTFDGTRPS
jgi:hypothetical protein